MVQKKERAARRTNEQLENAVMSALEALITERGFMNTSLLSFLKVGGKRYCFGSLATLIRLPARLLPYVNG